MNDRVLTIDDVMALKPCYDCAKVAELAGGRTEMRLSEILQLEQVPAADRIWLACQPGVLPDALRQQWVTGIVERAVRGHALHCGVPEVERWAAMWLSGEDRTAEAVWAAAWGARQAAAWAARAARAAAWEAGTTEYQRQLDDLLTPLTSTATSEHGSAPPDAA